MLRRDPWVAAARRTRRVALAAVLTGVLTIVLAGCAALFNPRTQEVEIGAELPSADVIVDGELRGTAPLILSLNTGERHEIVVRSETTSKIYVMEPTLSATAGAGLLVDALVIIPAGYVSLVTYGTSQIPGNPLQGQLVALSIGVAAVGVAPLVVDLVTDNLYELKPAPLTADGR